MSGFIDIENFVKYTYNVNKMILMVKYIITLKKKNI